MTTSAHYMIISNRYRYAQLFKGLSDFFVITFVLKLLHANTPHRFALLERTSNLLVFVCKALHLAWRLVLCPVLIPSYLGHWIFANGKENIRRCFNSKWQSINYFILLVLWRDSLLECGMCAIAITVSFRGKDCMSQTQRFNLIEYLSWTSFLLEIFPSFSNPAKVTRSTKSTSSTSMIAGKYRIMMGLSTLRGLMVRSNAHRLLESFLPFGCTEYAWSCVIHSHESFPHPDYKGCSAWQLGAARRSNMLLITSLMNSSDLEDMWFLHPLIEFKTFLDIVYKVCDKLVPFLPRGNRWLFFPNEISPSPILADRLTPVIFLDWLLRYLLLIIFTDVCHVTLVLPQKFALLLL